MSFKSQEVAIAARYDALRMAHRAQSSHIASSFSVIDILAVLYSDIARLNDDIHDSDAIIVSKGHAATATYAVMAHTGNMPLDKLDSYGVNGSFLGGHVNHTMNPGIILSTGSLGHGFPYGVGIALAQKRSGNGSRTFVVISDGECDEGTTWESALLAAHHQLDNLVVIIDRNRMQALGSTESTLALEPLSAKWTAFNWAVREINGHSHSELESSIQSIGSPLCIIANTVKGSGVEFMENSILWHYRPPNDVEFNKAMRELGGKSI